MFLEKNIIIIYSGLTHLLKFPKAKWAAERFENKLGNLSERVMPCVYALIAPK